jgi:thymidine phosphorylase
MSNHNKNILKVKRIGIDTYRVPVIYMREDCHICRSEGFEALSRISVTIGDKTIIATLNIIRDSLIDAGELGLSDAAWKLLNPIDNEVAYLSHPDQLESLSHVRSKIYGHTLEEKQFDSIIDDIVTGHYADIYLSAFITACAGNRLNQDEIVALTKSMINAGSKLTWDKDIIVDKHCAGGLPGNRTTLIIVPIVAAFGLTIPKTSSRAITSPSGTADTMETLAPVTLSMSKMQDVVNKEGGCIIWGGAVHLSPADDVLIAIERQLDVDSEGQLIASVLSKKAAAGSSHVLIDLPVGPTVKVRSLNVARQLSDMFVAVGNEIGLNVRVKITDGEQPVGNGIGPALEARDVLAILKNEKNAPKDLRERSLLLAGEIIELSGQVAIGEGYQTARKILEDGSAWNKFQAICEAQGGMRTLKTAKHTHEVLAEVNGIIESIDNRHLSLTAKLAGAPMASAAGLDLHIIQGSKVEKGQPLYTIHAETPGELEYALDYMSSQKDIVIVKAD